MKTIQETAAKNFIKNVLTKVGSFTCMPKIEVISEKGLDIR